MIIKMKLMPISREWMLIFYICLIFQIVGINAYSKNWNHCPLQSDALRLLPGVAFNECSKQCHIRNHCKLICYRRATNMCEIHGENAQTTTCKRCVSVLREDIPTTEPSVTPNTCAACNDGKTCDPSTGACDYTECGPFPSGETYGKPNGNLANVGAKKTAQCFTSTEEWAEMTCNNYGDWIGTACEHICPSHGSVYTLTGGIEILICNKQVKQPVAKQYCVILGGTLIKLDTVTKMSALRQLISDDPVLDSSDYWTDGYSPVAEDHAGWRFTDGSQVPMDKDTFWKDNAPNDGSGPSCVRLFRNADHRWNDRTCSALYNYICQI